MRKGIIGRRFRRFFPGLLALALGMGGIVPASASEAIQVTVPFGDPGCSEVWNWEFPYSDEWFLSPDNVFNRELAKGSIGLAISAFTPLRKQHLEPQNETYLAGAGFEKIRLFGYDQVSSTNSFAGVIAKKPMEGFTLIAVAGRGSGYGKEWGGNLLLGTGKRHEGFEAGAALLEEYLDQYLAEEPTEGPIRLWVTGYSRSAAVGNLAAADWTASGRFEAVYGGFFACPRNTTEPVKYPNLFNICGTWDFVPQIPMQVYGFERNGMDLFLPSQETVSDFGRMKSAVSGVSEQLAGRPLTNNPRMNLILRFVVSLVSDIFRTREEYAALLQDKIIAAMPDGEAIESDNLFLSMGISILSMTLPEGREAYAKMLVGLGTYASLMMTIGKESMIQEGTWDPDSPLFVNIVREHLVSTYLSWLFSGLDDDSILREAAPGRVLFLYPCTSLTVYRGEDPIWKAEKGTARKESEEAAGYVYANGDTVMIQLPTDAEYRMTAETKDGTLHGAEMMISPDRTLCESFTYYLAETPPSGAYEITASGRDSLTDAAGLLEKAEADYSAGILLELITAGLSSEECLEAVFGAFGKPTR